MLYFQRYQQEHFTGYTTSHIMILEKPQNSFPRKALLNRQHFISCFNIISFKVGFTHTASAGHKQHQCATVMADGDDTFMLTVFLLHNKPAALLYMRNNEIFYIMQFCKPLCCHGI